MIDPVRPGGARSLAADTTETFLSRALFFAVSFAASVVITRGLGPQGRGEYYLPVVAAGTMVALCKVGLEQANVYLYGARGVPIGHLSGQNGLVALLLGSLGVGVLQLAPRLLPRLFADTPPLLLLLAGLTIPFTLHAQFTATLLTLQGKVAWQFHAGFLAGLVQLAFLGALVVGGWLTVGPVLGGNLLATLLTWILVARGLQGNRVSWVRWDPPLLRATFRQSLLLHAAMVLLFLHLRLDMFMVKALVGTAALGQYSLAVVLAETVRLVTDSVAIAILPRQMGNSLEAAASLGLRGARTNVVLGWGFAAYAAAGVLVIRSIFGQAFAPAYVPFVLLLPGMMFLSMQRVCGGAVLRAGTPLRMVAIYACGLGVNIGLNAWLIPLWGPAGAALSSSLSYGLSASLFLIWTARLARLPSLAGMVPTAEDWLAVWQGTLTGIRSVGRILLAGKRALPWLHER